jgi:hypothetical protein
LTLRFSKGETLGARLTGAHQLSPLSQCLSTLHPPHCLPPLLQCAIKGHCQLCLHLRPCPTLGFSSGLGRWASPSPPAGRLGRLGCKGEDPATLPGCPQYTLPLREAPRPGLRATGPGNSWMGAYVPIEGLGQNRTKNRTAPGTRAGRPALDHVQRRESGLQDT